MGLSLRHILKIVGKFFLEFITNALQPLLSCQILKRFVLPSLELKKKRDKILPVV